MRDRILAGIFLAVIFLTGVSIGFDDILSKTLKTASDAFFASYGHVLSGQPEKNVPDVSAEISGINAEILDSLSCKNTLVDLNGSVLKKAGTRSYYNISDGINITTDGYNVGRYEATTTEYEVQQLQSFQAYLEEKGIRLLYVSKPAKYIDDSFYMEQFGGESYLNRNTDLFLSRIKELGIDCLDLRDSIREDGLDPLSLFYKTDHHWTVPASRWAAEKIAEKLNEGAGYDIDPALYDEAQFESIRYENCWLGEQGKKVSQSYIGLDDYVMMRPLYDTSYQILAPDGSVEEKGSFDIFINQSVYESTEDFYTAASWHYSYMPYTGDTIHNENAEYGNVLVLGDSYEASMLPFLSLGIENVKLLIPRDMKESVREYIEAGSFDTVIIAYAQFMIGAHDDPENANYRMFTLE